MGSVSKSARRLALVALAIAASIASSPPPAQATTLTTLGPTELMPTSAVLHGAVDTGGLGAVWQFVYGTSTRYGRPTPLVSIPVGVGSDYVVAFITGLRPSTTYHYRLIAIFRPDLDYALPMPGKDVTFTTKPLGRLVLLSRRLSVKGGVVAMPLGCRSTARCTGRLKLENPRRAQAPARANTTCAASAFSIPAVGTRTIRTRLRPTCRTLLLRAPRRRITATLAVKSTSGQVGITRVVSLSLS